MSLKPACPSVAAAPGVPQSSSLVHAKKEPFRITSATFLSDGLTINSLALHDCEIIRLEHRYIAGGLFGDRLNRD